VNIDRSCLCFTTEYLWLTPLLPSTLQPAWDLLTPAEISELLRDGTGCHPPTGQVLQRYATYELPVSRDDVHVQVKT
jgi:hypothetical protein